MFPYREIQIHLMLLFNELCGKRCGRISEIQIHLMLLFNIVPSCDFPPYTFKYISCYYSMLRDSLKLLPFSDSNTSHVIIQSERAVGIARYL